MLDKLLLLAPITSKGYAGYNKMHDFYRYMSRFNMMQYITGVENMYDIKLNIDYHVFYENMGSSIDIQEVEMLSFKNIVKLLENYYENKPLYTDIEFLNMKNFLRNIDTIKKMILDNNYKYVLLSTYNFHIFTNLYIVLDSLVSNDKTKFVIGGPALVSEYVSNIFHELGCIVRRGDLEPILIEYIETGKLKEEITKEYFNPGQFENYFPVYSKIQLEYIISKYKKFDFIKHLQEDFKEKTIFTNLSRNCPYTCSYCQCSSGVFGKYSTLTPKQIIRILDYYNSIIPENYIVRFFDNDFKISTKDFQEIYEGQRYPNLSFLGATSYRTMTDEVIETLNRNKFFNIELGYESSNAKTMGILNDKYRNDTEIYDILQSVLSKFNGKVRLDNMSCYPHYTDEDMKYDFRFLQNFYNKFHDEIFNFKLHMQFHYFRLMVDTEIFNNPDKYKYTFIYYDKISDSVPESIQNNIRKMVYKWTSPLIEENGKYKQLYEQLYYVWVNEPNNMNKMNQIINEGCK